MNADIIALLGKGFIETSAFLSECCCTLLTRAV